MDQSEHMKNLSEEIARRNKITLEEVEREIELAKQQAKPPWNTLSTKEFMARIIDKIINVDS